MPDLRGSVWRSDPVWLTPPEKPVRPGFQGKRNWSGQSLKKVFDNLSFQPDGGLGADVLRSSELLPPGRIECHDLITARYHGLDFSQCDIRIQDGSGDVTTTEDSQEGGREVPADVFQGRVMRLPSARLSAVLCWWYGATLARSVCSQSGVMAAGGNGTCGPSGALRNFRA